MVTRANFFVVKSTPVKKKITSAEVRELTGATWFDLQEEENQIILDSREHGDVGSESPGKPDLAEARRLTAELRKGFPRHDVSAEVVDEWVVVTISRVEKSQERLDQDAKEKQTLQLRKKWAPHIEAAISSVSKKCLDSGINAKNYSTPFTWSSSVSLGQKTWSTTFRAEYGVRHLYRDQQGVIPAFKTPEEIQPHLLALVKKLGGTLASQRVSAPFKKLTYNQPPPNNVIEEIGHVSYDVSMPLAPGTPLKALGKGLPMAKSPANKAIAPAPTHSR